MTFDLLVASNDVDVPRGAAACLPVLFAIPAPGRRREQKQKVFKHFTQTLILRVQTKVDLDSLSCWILWQEKATQ